MPKIAMNEQNDPSLRGRMYPQLAQYVAPIELSGENSGLVSMSISWTDPGAREARLADKLSESCLRRDIVAMNATDSIPGTGRLFELVCSHFVWTW
jgi:hypothetical protein